MKRLLLSLLLALAWAWPAGADTHASATCALSAVQAQVTAASSGDTVTVPACASTPWSGTLNITKRITLQGAGIGATNISGGGVSYSPSDTLVAVPASPADIFRMTGFTFTNTDLSMGRWSATAATWVRIDHNQWTCTSLQWLYVDGRVNGVFDHNTWVSICGFENYGGGSGGDPSWRNLIFTPGTLDNLYYEDNVFNTCFTTQTGGRGGRYGIRYNTYTLLNPSCMGSGGFYPLNESHGNQGSAVYAIQGTEVYGNRVTSSWTIGNFFDQRGGKAVVFWNKVLNTSSTGTRVREECEDTSNGTEIGYAPDGTPQHVNNSYWWNNRAGSSGTSYINVDQDWPPDGGNCNGVATVPLVENQDYFQQTALTNGSLGVGCGTSLPPTCTVGSDLTHGTPGFWVTNQSCASISDTNVGADRTSLITGTLYRCTAPNTWTPYFAPFPYPHPFQATVAPAAPTALAIPSTATPVLQWAHDAVGLERFKTVVDGAAGVDRAVPVAVGGVYSVAVSALGLTAGAHTIKVQACNLNGCTDSAAIIVVKL